MEKFLLSAGETSRWIGCSISTLKNYEEEGLLVPTIIVGKSKRMFSVSQVREFIVECCEGKEYFLNEEQGQSFLSVNQVRRRLRISNESLLSLEQKGILLPRRRLPLNHKRLYLESDVEKLVNCV